MQIEQIYTSCLSQGAYYIESKGEAAIIDPLREIQPYLDRAKKAGAQFKYIFETHFHADFVSGHLSLSNHTGAPIVFGPNAETDFPSLIAKDLQEFSLGDLTIRVLHTPGHTLESTCYLLIDSSGNDVALFTGDTLFLGDVGRPDLAQNQGEKIEDLAGLLYTSLREKIMPLKDDLLIYPAHGAGSACGKNMMKETVDRLGNQKKYNYALRVDMSKDEFINEVTRGLLPPPSYFPMNVYLNKSGYEDFNNVLARSYSPLDCDAFERISNDNDALILDVRHQDDFIKGHIPQSIFIGLDGIFAPWVGALIADLKQPILLICDKDRVREAITRLSRVGFDHVLGYLEGGFDLWKSQGREYDTINRISAKNLANKVLLNELSIFDVRKESEYASQHVEGAIHTPLDYLHLYFKSFPEKETFYIYCAAGYRSAIASSILKKRGIHNFIDVQGGFESIKKSKIVKTTYVCPQKL